MCMFYNISSDVWDTSGCEPSPLSKATELVCQCNHLTTFGGSVLVPPNAIDIGDIGVCYILDQYVMSQVKPGFFAEISC